MAKPKIIASETSFDWTGLQRFAKYFHQDFGMMYPEPLLGVTDYIDQLSPKEAALLCTELEKFLADNKSKQALRKAWIKAGAGFWLDRIILEQALTLLANKS